MLSGCVSSGSVEVRPTQLAEIPPDVRSCFVKLVPMPALGRMTARQAYELIGALKKSELAKSQCGQRLIQFYDRQQPG